MQNHNSSIGEISSLSPKNPSSNERRSRGSSHSKEGETSQPVAAGFQMEDSSPRIISREGCFTSAGYQLLSDRWAAAMHLCNDPTVDVSERPVMYHVEDVLSETKPLQQPSKTLPPPKLTSDYITKLCRGLADSKVVKF